MTAAETPPSPRSVASWVIYDLANTIFAFGVVGFYFADWMGVVGQPDRTLAITIAAASLVVIFLAPWAGARSDVRGTRIPTLVATTLIAVGGTALLDAGPIPLTFVMLWVALIGVNTGSVVYDALLVDVSTPENRGWVSGLGVGIGYVGSFIGLAIGWVTLDVLGWGHAATFRTLAAAFLIFAIPAFLFIRERPRSASATLPGLVDVVARIVKSWRKASRYEGVVRFLVGRFFYTDAINTLIAGFLAIFVIDELGMDRESYTLLIGIAIVAAIGGGLGTGRFVARMGPLRVLRFVLILWMIAIASGIAAAVTGQTSLAWLLGPIGGVALGATWASDRVVMTRVSPPRHLGEFYGLYATVGRFATIAGPLVWALVVDALRWGRSAALAALIGFIAAGWLILRKVDDRERDWPAEDLMVVSGSPDGRQT